MGLLWITLSNIKTVAPVFNVNIVGPLETEKPSVPKIPQPKATQRKPLIEKQNKQHINEKPLPETLYGTGKGAPQERGDSTHTNKGAQTDIKENKNNSSPLKNEGEIPDDNGILPSEKHKPSLLPPSALFDEKTIENYAKKESPADKGLTFEMPGFEHRGYMRMLKEKIESIWRYPKDAARLGISGDLYLKFSIKKDGKLGEVELLRTSGYKDFDEAAIKALKDAEPFWPLPADWEKDDLEITGHFIYIYGSAVIM
jgi:protein TonB